MTDTQTTTADLDYDYVVVGSGFGGSVSALRLSEKGYRVLVIEKGKWLKEKDFPKTNWNIKRWMWLPLLRCFGLFRLTYFRHVAVVSGVGVGGGSLVYANTLPVPKSKFFQSPSWSHLADWEQELKPFYQRALSMLGATTCPKMEEGDFALKKIAEEMNREEYFEPTQVGVYFGTPDETVEDPYFNGEGPERTGCIFCGGCMLGCRYNAKNTLDKNYLHLAQNHGAKIQAESQVYDVLPLDGQDGSQGYKIKFKKSTSLLFKKKGEVTTRGVIFSGGVLGTIPLLLKLKESSLPNLSSQVGKEVRTNNESLVLVTTFDRSKDFSKGIAIQSIFHPDEHSHLEPVRYSAGSGFWRILMAPMIHGNNVVVRIFKTLGDILFHPIKNLRVFFVDDFAKRTQILLFMQALDSTLSFSRGLFGMKSSLHKGEKPSAFIPEAKVLSEKFAEIIDGKPQVVFTETLFGIPSTAHILGGATMGTDKSEGVIDKDNLVFDYQNMMVCDGSMISANPGVNPSLTITALTELAMSKIPEASKRNSFIKGV